jgi:glycosyltransferase Alg8
MLPFTSQFPRTGKYRPFIAEEKIKRILPSYSASEGFVFKGRYRNFTLRWQDMLHLYFYVGIWCVILLSFPNGLYDARARNAAFFIVGISSWRYSWFIINFVRSQYYGRVRYPRMRAQADRLWAMGWRPAHVHFVMTTFYEYPPTTYKCLQSIIREIADCGVKATLWIGCGSQEDEEVIKSWFVASYGADMDIIFVRQNVPGKRAAIGLTLRALSRSRIAADDLAVLMDGDAVIGDGALRKCLSFLGAFRHIQALTTDEEAVCERPAWMQKWLALRFAQRRMWMQSHSLSNRVLTLTGRFSVFRAANVVDIEFIRLIEADYLRHWFWGNFRFLSGDDKSSFYYLLSHRCGMVYVPDAMVYTIERIEGSAVKRALDNTLRWSGNMLRNGMRAIRLGPRVVPPFIWWCLIDQRITIWTTLAGVITAISTILFIKGDFIFTYILWIMLTRFLMSIALFFYTERLHMSFAPALYCNQLLTAFAKIYLIFRLPQQRWANRKDQSFNHKLMSERSNRIAVLWINLFYLTAMALAILLLLKVLKWPDIQQIF